MQRHAMLNAYCFFYNHGQLLLLLTWQGTQLQGQIGVGLDCFVALAKTDSENDRRTYLDCCHGGGQRAAAMHRRHGYDVGEINLK